MRILESLQTQDSWEFKYTINKERRMIKEIDYKDGRDKKERKREREREKETKRDRERGRERKTCRDI